ncbi:MAG TPA: alpha/beta fold hydrolase [Ktedonobacterales bacterium]|nr:alpha/beta fold hydrolase [Ktedonobacterales bacterium]
MPSRSSKRRARLDRGSGVAALLSVAGGLGALAVVNRAIARRAGEPFSALSGESRRYPWTEGDVFYKVKGQGEPLVLAHGISAGASAFEWRKNVDALAEHFRVYAPDLLGFGLSSRPRLDYTAQTFVQLLIDFVREAAGGAEHPVHVVASSLSAAYAIMAAFQRPKLFERLVLVEPAGVYALSRGPTLAQRAFWQVMRAPIIGESVYNAVASRAAMHSYLSRHVYLRPEAVTADLVDYYYIPAHQPGARYVPLRFVTGHLNIDIAEAFAQLSQPTLIVWGKQAEMAPAAEAQAFQRLNPGTQVEIINGSKMLPQDEQPERFQQRVIDWLRQPAAART